jgi:hypothetical protein
MGVCDKKVGILKPLFEKRGQGRFIKIVIGKIPLHPPLPTGETEINPFSYSKPQHF